MHIHFTKINWLLFLMRNALVSRFFYWYAVPKLMERVREHPQNSIPLILSALVNSQSPRLSRGILFALAGLPEEILEQSTLLRDLFLRENIRANSLKEAIHSCQAALTICFAAG